jgi:hypothetical protein
MRSAQYAARQKKNMKNIENNGSNEFKPDTQVNARIPAVLAEAIKLVAARIGLKDQDVIAAAVAAGLGIKDANLEYILKQIQSLTDWNLTPVQRGYFKALQGKMERAKGLEPSTFTLAR